MSTLPTTPTTADTPWVGARMYGRHCAATGAARVPPDGLHPDAQTEFFYGYDQEKRRADRRQGWKAINDAIR